MIAPYILAGLMLSAGANEELRLPVTRDTWFSDFPTERDGNLGGEARLKLKSIQEMSLVDLDPAPLRGRVVAKAALHLRLAAEPRLHRVTVGTFGSDWTEGTSRGYAPQAGSSSFAHRASPNVPWTRDGGDLCRVMLGLGGTAWRMADASGPDQGRWQAIPVDPLIVAARAAGLSRGFLVFDDTGSEWTRDGERFEFRLFPNRFVRSREAGAADAPYFTVQLGPEDRNPPAAPGPIAAEAGDLPAGEAWVTWPTPRDEGPAGTLGFLVRANGQDVPRDLIPLAGAAGEPVRMHLRDLGPEAAAPIELDVRAVDGAGNVGPPASATIRLSTRLARPLPGRDPSPFAERAPLPKLGGAEVAILDELDKVRADTGALIPAQPDGYRAANHLWSAKDRTIRLHAARNEFVAFQVALRGSVRALRPALEFAGGGIEADFGAYGPVATKLGPLPDPIVSLGGPADVRAPGGSLHVELYVPHDAAPGEHRGTLTLRSGEESLQLNVSLTVWDFTLPDALSFLPEMNAYGLPANERDYYRLAHRHRTVLNRLPYSQNGTVMDGGAPKWDGRSLDWSDWDRRFGPLLDGSAFADLPRKGVPVECFYLPLHENWPTPMAGHYNGSYWADGAFTNDFRRAFVEVSRQFAAHFNERGWNRTLFHGFLNNKVDFKRNGWSRGSSPWLLDEPSSFQDYWALRWFGIAFHEGVNAAPGAAKMVFRCDISRPQWQRDALDGLLDFNVVGSAMRTYRRIVMDRKAAQGQVVVEYGGANAIEAPNTQPLGWCLDAWALGADGVLPWQTIGRAESWRQADPLALFYPGNLGRGGDPVPSVRLKAFRRGQQDVEYLTLLARATDEPRWAVGQRLREALRLAGERQGSGLAAVEDAGVIAYARLRPQDAWRLRVRLGEALSALRPAPRRELVEFRTPRRDLSGLAPGYVRGAGPKPGAEARTAAAAPGPTLVLQGREAVRDALIDPARPDQALGPEPRDNAVRKADPASAFLVRFDLDRLKLPPRARVRRATLSLFVWDPSNQGRTRLHAFPLRTPWDESAATWSRPAAGQRWRGGDRFALDADAGPPGPPAVVPPDEGGDLADPPREVALDVTESVRSWRAGSAPNHGWAIAPVADRSVDDGHTTRFQVLASESGRAAFTPKLTIELER